MSPNPFPADGKVMFRIRNAATRISKRIISRRTRIALAALDDRLLKDVGLSRGDLVGM
ncbi:hypothetical protein GCM10007036_10980 [Alsobacter metallidurans]|uniref:YjiS-like domain-containing protein n=1 Tax=Alsobacter metallidurans TaxID=340221 RepID=A0A917MG48_9HYPH|nr:DUF1127 domain-containing protein [Alsobacter metallidurans]GGH12818.1 hypothetical protein GCM10007036_10980 [Alsobacter metallidurans]